MSKRLRIIVLAIPVLLVAAASALYIRTMGAQGRFDRTLSNTSAACRSLPANGPEDMAFEPYSGLLFISQRAIGKPRNRPSAENGLYTLIANDPNAKPVKLDAGLADFQPHGISLFRGRDGNLALMAVNHRSDGAETVEIFDAAATQENTQLFHRQTIASPLFESLDDVVAVAKDRFYVTNGNGSRTAFGRWLENNLLLPRATLVYFDGTGASMAAEGLRTANGVNVSPDGRRIYVAETNGRRIRTYRRDQFSGVLTEPEEGAVFSLPLNIDNLDVMSDGIILATGHPKIADSRAHGANPGHLAPSATWRVRVQDGIPASADLLFADDGNRLGASSVAVRAGRNLFVGSAFSNHFLACRL